MKIQRYEVVYANSEQAFVEQINKMIKEGWQPLGGMAANFQSNGQFQQTVYHQAMVMYETEYRGAGRTDRPLK
jgi:hypothetical protein